MYHFIVVVTWINDCLLFYKCLFQSVVLLSKFPLINLFYKVVGLIAPEFFENGEPSIEAACHDVDQWPLPQPGETLHLPLLGTVLQVCSFPSYTTKWGNSDANRFLNSCIHLNRLLCNKSKLFSFIRLDYHPNRTN